MSLRGKRVDWTVYFSINNIELEILLNNIDIILREMRASTPSDLVRPVVFNTINPSFIDKLVNRGILKRFYKRGRQLYAVTNRGLKAFFAVVSPLIDIVRGSNGVSAETVAEKVKERVFYGGVHRVYNVHVKLIERMLSLLVSMGFLRRNGDNYYPVETEGLLDSIAGFLGKVSAVSPLRRIDELAGVIGRYFGLSQDQIDDIVARLATTGYARGEVEPGKAFLELIIKAKRQAIDHAHSGRLLESLAYEALGLEASRLYEKLSGFSRSGFNYKLYFQFYFYETLGDYFYHNLQFEPAKLCYHWAVNTARESLELARDAHRANAKYLLSLARSLAQKGRFEEAIARLDELAGYYRSTGLLREAMIAGALKKEYQAELEVRKNKPCNAYGSWMEATSKYEELGGEYRGRAKALRVKALISRAECLIHSDKNVEEAVAVLEEASRISDEILSPHLKNVARSMLHEVRASLLVSRYKLLEASREYAEAAKYYELRGYDLRSLLNSARSSKFLGFHYIVNGNIKSSIKSLREAMESYLELLRRNTSRRSRKTMDCYLVKEGIKGYYDTKALLTLAETYDEIRATPVVNEYVVNRISRSLYEALSALLEAGRQREYAMVERVLRTVKKIPLQDDVKGLISVLGEIAELNDSLAEVKDESPRFIVLTRLIQQLLSTMKSGLEVITRYVEELGVSGQEA